LGLVGDGFPPGARLAPSFGTWMNGKRDPD
jgi:hypothetical protein